MGRRDLRLHLLLWAAGGFSAGCAGTVSTAPGTGDAEAAATNAVLVVERAADPTEGVHAEASARFVRVSTPLPADQALRAIGASLDLPARGGCAGLAFLTGSMGPGAPGERPPLIELADVGSVSLETSGMQTGLLPRQLPDVTDVVSGVVYARAGDSDLFPAGERYDFHISGGPDLDPLDVSATAPADPVDVRVVGEDGSGTATLPAWAPIEFVWTQDAQDADDTLYVDVQPVGGSGIRCVLAPDGTPSTDGLAHQAVPAALLVDDHGPFTDGTIVIHRLRRQPLHARGLDGGEVRFDFARSIAYRR